jgi:hypothetical protein
VRIESLFVDLVGVAGSDEALLNVPEDGGT